MTLMIHLPHGLGPSGALSLLQPPHHEITVSTSVVRKLENCQAFEMLGIGLED